MKIRMTDMRKKSLTKNARKIQIVTWFAIRIQHDNLNYASMYEIAKGLGMSPSTHLSNILQEMVTDETLEQVTQNRPGRWPSRGYMLKNDTFQRPTKRQIPINFHANGIKQMELFS
jgi:hypothetical protein